MRRILWLVLLLAATHGPASAQNQSIAEMARLFDYDKNAPIDIKEVGFKIITPLDAIKDHTCEASSLG